MTIVKRNFKVDFTIEQDIGDYPETPLSDSIEGFKELLISEVGSSGRVVFNSIGVKDID